MFRAFYYRYHCLCWEDCDTYIEAHEYLHDGEYDGQLSSVGVWDAQSTTWYDCNNDLSYAWVCVRNVNDAGFSIEPTNIKFVDFMKQP